MKQILGIITLILFPVFVFAEGIKFEHGTLNEALQKAKSENKLVFIDGYAVWCGPCKKMAATVFTEDEVGAYYDKHFVALKVDVERGEGPSIKRKYGITALPGYVFLDPDGNVVYRFSASMSTQKFLEQVRLAVDFAKDSNSAGRLAEKYESEKNNEIFLSLYLQKLKESKSTDYTDVLEQYLKIQKSVPVSSKDMVCLLADHAQEIVFGGLADSIMQENIKTDAWKLWVRKGIRETYQKIPRYMVESTTDYAIAKNDSTILELALDRAVEAGVNVNADQRKRTYQFFYEKTGQGEKYKTMVYPENEKFIQSLNTEDLHTRYLEWKAKMDAGDPDAKIMRPYSVRYSQQIASLVYNYAQFATSEKDKQDVIRWMQVAYYIIPGDFQIMNQYADILYLFGNDKKEAIRIKEQALKIANESNEKRGAGIFEDLEDMKKGNTITLK